MTQQHTQRAASVALFRAALDAGINFVDTARGYFDSESILGEALKGRRADCIVASKTYLRGFKAAYRQLEESLQQLQFDYIDIYQIHHVQYLEELEQVMAPGGAYAALSRAREQGLIRWIGVSSHNPEVLRACLRTGAFDTAQFPFNPVESEFWDTVQELVRELDIGTIVMKPFCGGNITSTAAALRYLLSFPVSTVIPGCTTGEQLESNLEVLRNFTPLSSGEQERLKAEIKQLPELFCRRCRYCVATCPQHLPVPEIFRCEDYLILNATYARNSYQELTLKADSCQKCGKCETICPYHLPVRAFLQRAHRRLTRGALEDFAVKLCRRLGIYDIMRKFYFTVFRKIPER